MYFFFFILLYKIRGFWQALSCDNPGLSTSPKWLFCLDKKGNGATLELVFLIESQLFGRETQKMYFSVLILAPNQPLNYFNEKGQIKIHF